MKGPVALHTSEVYTCTVECTAGAVCSCPVGARHQRGEVLGKPASVRSYDGADDCGGNGRGVPEVHTGE